MTLVVKNLPTNANAGDVRDTGLILGLGRSPGEGNGNPLQYSCLESPMDREAWWATVHRLAESDMTEATEQALMERPTTDDRLIEWVANSFCLSHVNLC